MPMMMAIRRRPGRARWRRSTAGSQEVEGHELLGEHQAAEHGEAHGRQEVGGNAKASKDKGRDEVEQALDGVSTQIERQRAQQERMMIPVKPIRKCIA